jgi:membrane-associated phospholipid phosphatase
MNSFPSGHSATAFALFLCLSIMVNRSWLKYLMFVFAALVCYSRMYLSEHFLQDVFGGSVIGISVSFLAYLFFERFCKKLTNNSIQIWLNEKIRKIKGYTVY